MRYERIRKKYIVLLFLQRFRFFRSETVVESGKTSLNEVGAMTGDAMRRKELEKSEAWKESCASGSRVELSDLLEVMMH